MMLRVLLCLVLVLSFSVFAKRMKWAQPKEKGVIVYEDLSKEKSYTIGLDDRLRVINKKGDYYHVYHDGKYGWVKKGLVVLLKSSEHNFDDTYIQAEYTEKSPVYIIDADSWEDIPLKLNRSFEEALKNNVDRETVERQNK